MPSFSVSGGILIGTASAEVAQVFPGNLGWFVACRPAAGFSPSRRGRGNVFGQRDSVATLPVQRPLRGHLLLDVRCWRFRTPTVRNQCSPPALEDGLNDVSEYEPS